ncbi:MAG TPA: TlpA disulfide reductase family protein [Microthrixaceae bacterium]|nr:TlpA disulfide reductase family protein [Microthrixaceae bacterium]HMX64888.1 TlpA disulfide reductase family protein [Microthrixaceae bacterium]HNA35306.1 TlpA disulfide reductase family protein [Microthrixaceae bacterium]HNE75363.1 TlpA disulfide reductase family protein [Microthrixaceae bacterium]HNJ23010.1 TlpA disulfide reductase family protein [Microthrixaceae bacterium]
MTGSSHKRDPHGGADPYSKLSHAQDRRRRTIPMVIGGTVVVVAICALVAILATRSDDTDSGAAAGTGAAAAANAEQETADITVTGEPLPSMPEMAPGSYFTDVSTDKAIGMPAPSIDGSSFDGTPVKVDTGDGTPRVIVFVAHWCPHCQKEVPAIQQWIDDGNLPKGVEIVYVSTGVAPERGNYPVSDWIEKEGVTPKVVLDDDQSAAASDYGLSGFPYFVMIDGQGKVVARGSGEIPMDVFGPAVDALAAGQDPTAAS